MSIDAAATAAGHLGQRVGGTAEPSEAADEAQAPGPLGRLHVDGLRPLQRPPHGDVLLLELFQQVDEARQQPAGVLHLEAHAAAQRQVLLQGLAQRAHRAAPGHGSASGRSASRSTRA